MPAKPRSKDPILTLQILTWGALAGQLALVLDVGAASAAPSFQPVEALEKIDALGHKCHNFQVRAPSNNAVQDYDYYALGRACQNRDMLVSVVAHASYFPLWYNQAPYTIAIIHPGEKLPVMVNELWCLVASADAPDLDLGRLPPGQFPGYVFSQDLGDAITWADNSRYKWGFLGAEKMGAVQEVLL